MKFLYTLIRLWIYWGDFKEALNDTRFKYNKVHQKELSEKLSNFKPK